MNKYQNYNYNAPQGEIGSLLMPNETIIWAGKPKKNAYVMNRAMTMMPFALIWLLIDGIVIATFAMSGMFAQMGGFVWAVVAFFAVHLIPVWIWIGNVLTAGTRWKNTEYAVTDKRIIIRSGFLSYEYQNIYYKEITDIHLHFGIIDRMLHVGDIMICVASHGTGSSHSHNVGIIDIENAEHVFKIVQKAILDIQTDIEFPNAYRPNVNQGYQTNYRGF